MGEAVDASHMAWTKPLVAVLLLGIGGLGIGAAYALLSGIVLPIDTPSIIALGVVVVAVVGMVLVGRRSNRWTDNPENYW